MIFCGNQHYTTNAAELVLNLENSGISREVVMLQTVFMHPFIKKVPGACLSTRVKLALCEKRKERKVDFKNQLTNFVLPT